MSAESPTELSRRNTDALRRWASGEKGAREEYEARLHPECVLAFHVEGTAPPGFTNRQSGREAVMRLWDEIIEAFEVDAETTNFVEVGSGGEPLFHRVSRRPCGSRR